MSPSIMDKFPANTKFVVIKPPVKRRPAIGPSDSQPSISTASSPVSEAKVTSPPQPAITATKRKFEVFDETDHSYKDAKRTRLNESEQVAHNVAPQSSPNKRKRSDEVASEETRPMKQLKTGSLSTTSAPPARNQENINPATRSVRGVSPKIGKPRTQPFGTGNVNKESKRGPIKDKDAARKLSAIVGESASKAVAPGVFQSKKAKILSPAGPAPARPAVTKSVSSGPVSTSAVAIKAASSEQSSLSKHTTAVKQTAASKQATKARPPAANQHNTRPKQSASHKKSKGSTPELCDCDTSKQTRREVVAASEDIIRRNKDKALKKWRADQYFNEVSDRVRNIFDESNRPKPRISDYTETIIQVCKDFGLGDFLEFSASDQKRMLEEVGLRNAWSDISKQYNKAYYSYHNHQTPAHKDALNQEEDLKQKFESRNPQFVERYECLRNEKNRRSEYPKKWRAERCREEFFTNGPWACQRQANKARAAAAPGQKRK